MINVLSSLAFLEQWKEKNTEEALLEKEVSLIEKRMSEMAEQLRHLIEQKKQVTGGDDWHDGAFRATDSEANNLSENHTKLSKALGWQIVEMPDSELQVATLGSRITVRQDKRFTYLVDLVGMSLLHEYADDDEQVVTSLSSPLGKTLMGREVGSEIRATLGERPHLLELLETRPSPKLQPTTGS